VPHFRDLQHVRRQMAAGAGESAVVIDVRQPIEDIIEIIRMCKRIASSSLHGLIVAHAYGVPAQWVRLGHVSGDGVKYHDYFHSVGIKDAEPVRLDLGTRFDAVALSKAVEAAPLPDVSQLQLPLLDACPFIAPALRGGLSIDPQCASIL
jgi:pyruvyltransferase